MRKGIVQSPTINHIQLVKKENVADTLADQVQESALKYFRIDPGKTKSGKIFTIVQPVSEHYIRDFAYQSLQDTIIHDVYINRLYQSDQYQSYLLIAKLPGLTDDEGISAQKAFIDLLNPQDVPDTQWIFTQDIFYFEQALTESQLQQLAEELLGNPLVNHFEYGSFNGTVQYTPDVRLHTSDDVQSIDVNVPNEQLQQLSRDLLLALDLKEMQAIKNHFANQETIRARKDRGLSAMPTDCELEVLAQTWSEHCKHKEFNALITYTDRHSGEVKTIDSLFKTYIKRSTDMISKRLEKAGQHWLLKVFSDNAGVVRINQDKVFIWKVETHNSPSALDPYGGALTGIVGVNRDPLGTGIGGGKLLFNTDVLCFGPPDYQKTLLPGQLHPRRIMSGVIKGIEDGGNKSGIPTVNGSVVFDDRFAGKPLVFCGTGAVMPARYNGRNSWDKIIDPGDRIIMAGGRVGKDGIHGATFSSLEIGDHSPRSAVQIGSPITQKNMSDFMERAAAANWIKSSTDNGAGGLSSSIGELARIPGGAVVELDRVPLKYAGLKPWEIFVSESQERMTLVIDPHYADELFELAGEFEVELSDIGYFTDEGFLQVLYDQKTIAWLDLDFLHDGVPKKQLTAEWQKPQLSEPKLPEITDYNDILMRLLGRFNIRSREDIIRRYDHEVKGKTIIKPLMGRHGYAPQDAAVMRIDFDSHEGLLISNGIKPRIGDIDPYQMSANAFDEAVRSIISVGGRLPDLENGHDLFWTVNDNFCVPDSVYHPQNNPDGKIKLAKLVQMNEALYDMATFFNIPMTSGKDSMKNDFIRGGTKISVPPTILYSMVAQTNDYRQTVTAEFKASGDLIYVVGQTYNELGASEFYQLFEALGAHAPRVRPQEALRVYTKMMRAHTDNLLASSHDISDGGLAVALAEALFGGQFGADIKLHETRLPGYAQLFSESPSRFVVSVTPQKQQAFEAVFGEDCHKIGRLTQEPRLKLSLGDQPLIDIQVDQLLNAWRAGLEV
ncbi:MAG: phosphoribosylformylglycinamidine synthase [Caldithrix sp.]|nr:phosphoribosylformylglycinamidine synthase [Caldithrix sp.]